MAKHSIFDFQSPDADLKDDVLRSRLFEILRKYASGPVISTELEELFVYLRWRKWGVRKVNYINFQEVGLNCKMPGYEAYPWHRFLFVEF